MTFYKIGENQRTTPQIVGSFESLCSLFPIPGLTINSSPGNRKGDLQNHINHKMLTK